LKRLLIWMICFPKRFLGCYISKLKEVPHKTKQQHFEINISNHLCKGIPSVTSEHLMVGLNYSIYIYPKYNSHPSQYRGLYFIKRSLRHTTSSTCKDWNEISPPTGIIKQSVNLRHGSRDMTLAYNFNVFLGMTPDPY